MSVCVWTGYKYFQLKCVLTRFLWTHKVLGKVLIVPKLLSWISAAEHRVRSIHFYPQTEMKEILSSLQTKYAISSLFSMEKINWKEYDEREKKTCFKLARKESLIKMCVCRRIAKNIQTFGTHNVMRLHMIFKMMFVAWQQNAKTE